MTPPISIIFTQDQTLAFDGQLPPRGETAIFAVHNETTEPIIAVVVQGIGHATEAVRVPATGTKSLELEVAASTVVVHVAELVSEDPQVKLTKNGGAPTRVEFQWEPPRWSIRAHFDDEGTPRVVESDYAEFLEEHRAEDWVVSEGIVCLVGVRDPGPGCLSVDFDVEDALGVIAHPAPDQEVGPHNDPRQYEFVVKQRSPSSFCNDFELQDSTYYAFNLYRRLAQVMVT